MRYFKGLKKIVFIIVCFFSLTDIRSFSQEEVDKSKNKIEKKKDVKEFTEKQLNEYVIKELEKKLKKIGRSKILSFSKELFKKEEDLKLIELNLKREKEKIELMKKNFEKSIKEFRKKQSKIISCLDKQDLEKNKRLNHMVEVISNMRPQAAAQLLSVQENDIALKILGALDSVKVSKIFNLMTKEISSRLQKQYINMKR
ncbi:MAG: hypothetical protein CME68_09800 [Halobacteriovoraceae bacterium]|nr:hypothetical protein [Halobacteriovoraceae bacterium]